MHLSTSRHNLRRFRRDQSGAVAVEFVLIGPILFALLFGIIVIAYFMGLSHSVSQLATGAARASVSGLDAEERQDFAESYLAEGSSRYPLLAQTAITPQVTIAPGHPSNITVQVTYDLDGSILDLANGFLGLDLANIKGSAFLEY
ncbi:TadE-like protein [Sulfitobacter noctilucae]|uniref:TadE/TadG family type IV pilus assembly protein n=1 Tax=Sulfitobacter noctilucae TaxID=1342302 RepID=UPI0004687028|nr:TadE/TadG family type IV pilus assembly protein [Sulfitobacter noctilucae]KIN70666.1 TadE-like protein [Sulfitobacter noctilucae]